jgi:hypothetical protein
LGDDPLIASRALSETAKWYASQHLLLPLSEFPSLLHHALEPLILTILNRRSGVFLKLNNLEPAGSFMSRGVGSYIPRRVAERGGSSKIHLCAAPGGNACIACVHPAKLLRTPRLWRFPLVQSLRWSQICGPWELRQSSSMAPVLQNARNISERPCCHMTSMVFPAAV